MTKTTTRRAAWVAAIALVATTAGCAALPDRGGFNCNRRWGGGTIGGTIAGGLIGGGLGGGIAATSGETERQGKDLALGIGVGTLTGAAIGLLIGHCGFDPQWEAEAPPPLPPPPPPPPPPAPTHRRIVLRGVNFDFDKATIRRDAADILDEAAELLRDQPDVDVWVDGHTDAIGSDAYNQRLSERRARAVLDYLSRHGVSASRLHWRGFGESRPVASNDTEEGRAQNRRVELNIQGGGRSDTDERAPYRERRQHHEERMREGDER